LIDTDKYYILFDADTTIHY